MIWSFKVTFADASGQKGISGWRIEAFDEVQARQMLSVRLRQHGHVATDITNENYNVDNDHPIVAGRNAAIEEVYLKWENALDNVEISLVLPSDSGPADLPSWLPSALWSALYQYNDDARVYAVIDPQLSPFLEHYLTDEIDDHRCAALPLFSLDGSDDAIVENSPWLVDLTLKDNKVPDAPPNALFRVIALYYLEQPGGIFLRSPVGLDEMHRSLRKLTKIRDYGDKWYFNRFWEPEFFLYFISFLSGRNMLSPISHVTGIAAVAGDALLMAACDLTSCISRTHDRDADLDLLFEAGLAMVAMRQARTLEAKYVHGLDPADVYAFAKERLGLEGYDYAHVCMCIDICYGLQSFFGTQAQDALYDNLIARLFDDEGDITLELPLFHGHIMFALSQNIAPHLLRNTFWRS